LPRNVCCENVVVTVLELNTRATVSTSCLPSPFTSATVKPPPASFAPPTGVTGTIDAFANAPLFRNTRKALLRVSSAITSGCASPFRSAASM
jgi:hypothetical protein